MALLSLHSPQQSLHHLNQEGLGQESLGKCKTEIQAGEARFHKVRRSNQHVHEERAEKHAQIPDFEED